MASIQLPIPSPLITSGDFTAEVRDPGSGAPTQVIRTEDAWSVYTEWNVKGPAVAILDGTWRLQVALESIGNLGVEMVTPAVLVPYSTGSLSGVYPNEKMSFSASVPFAAGTPPLGGQPDVPYHVSALLTFITPGATPGPFAAVVDLGLIQIFDSPLP
jgi:hypothetical protein